MIATNLQYQLTSFVGREDDLAAVRQLLASYRLVTLTGVGGAGKTRLAIQVANSTHETYPDGVWLVDLAPVHDPALVPQVVTQTVGLRLSLNEPVFETLERFLEPKRLLLILDNCEHVREACAHLAGELLSHARELRMLATSREVLGLAGETLYPLSGMAWPELAPETGRDGQSRPDLQQLSGYDAIRLFIDRAKACFPNFRLTAENARAVIEICRRLDGLPLALELASARVNILTVQEIAERLAGGANTRFALHLSGPRSGADQRHHTLQDAIDWSYALLPADEQALFRRLAVFAAGFPLEAAEAICKDEKTPNMQVLDGISSLIHKSLVVADTLGRAQARYRLLETIREYALEKLLEAGEISDLRNRHLDFFLARAEEAAVKLTGAYQQLWLNWLESEQDNLRAALAWSLESGRIEVGLRVALALGEFWGIRGYTEEILAWFQRLLAQANEQVSPKIRVNALVNMSYMAMAVGDAQLSQTYGLEAVQVAETAGRDDKALLALASHSLGTSAMAVGDFQTAYTILEQAVPIYRETGPSYYYRMALNLQGQTAIQLGFEEIAFDLLNESLVMAQEEGDLIHVADIQNALGDLARLRNDYEGAVRHYNNSAALIREIRSPNGLASIAGNLGFTDLFFGKVESAKACFNESMTIYQEQRNREGLVECVIGFAALAIVSGQPAAGIRLLAAAAAISGHPAASKWKATQMEVERYRDLARARLPETTFKAEQDTGRSMSLEQAVGFALSLTFEPIATGQDQELPGKLTAREREVAALIGQGKTNSEIADELMLSKRTVETHVSNILSKLQMARRAQILHWAIENGLTQTVQ